VLKILKDLLNKVFKLYVQSQLKNDSKNNSKKIIWRGDENSAKEVQKELKDASYNFLIMNGDKRWNIETKRKEYYTEEYILYVDALGGYIELDSVLVFAKVAGKTRLFIENDQSYLKKCLNN